MGTEQFQRDFVQEVVYEEPAKLLRALVSMEDAQASIQILRLSAVSRLSYLLHAVPPSIMHQAAAGYDALVEWALASVITGDGAASVGLPTSKEAVYDPSVCQDQTYLGDGPLLQDHLHIRKGGLELKSSDAIKGAAYIGCHALVLGHVVAASARGTCNPSSNGSPSAPWHQHSWKS